MIKININHFSSRVSGFFFCLFLISNISPLHFLGAGARPGPLMRCRCCPGLDLLPMRRRGQRGTGAAPPFESRAARSCTVQDASGANSPPSAGRPHWRGPSPVGPTLRTLLSPALALRSPQLRSLPSFPPSLAAPSPSTFSFT